MKTPRSFRFRPAIRWPGGKSKLLESILPCIPKHDCYVEPFGGGLAVLLAKPRSQVEVVNDLPGLTDIQRAARWFVRNKIGFGGDGDSFGVSVSHGLPSRVNRMETIRQLNLRLDQVTIEHLDWQRCLELYDRPTTFFFIDPPYTDCEIRIYSPWKESDILILRERLFKLRGKWLLTLNDSPAIRRIFHDCQLQSITRARGINNKTAGVTYKELIIQPR